MSKTAPGQFEIGAAELFTRYVTALQRLDLDAIAGLFTPEAQVVSPLYGVMKAGDYHRLLLGDTDRTRPQLCAVFDHANNGTGAAAHLRFAWTLADRETVEFEAVDVVELSPERDRFARLTMIYDSQPVRDAWAAYRERQLQQLTAEALLGGSRPAA
jgi:hypothetical protein